MHPTYHMPMKERFTIRLQAMNTQAVIFLVVTAFVSHCFAALWEETLPFVQTSSGKLRGMRKLVLGKEVNIFNSVPFAKPPISALRFQPPQPVDAWGGIREAYEKTKACVQERDVTFPGFVGSEMWNPNVEMDEDCLQMSIWAPAKGKNMPVLVWLFGGGFWYGSPSLDIYNADALSAHGDVIVINVNYRVGAFGFLFLDHTLVPGNVGLLDQQLAIKWIRANIHNFGGDPSRITLFGESAGAASVVAHMVAPSSRGLFNNGVLQSGSLQNPWAMDSPERALNKSQEFLMAVGCELTKENVKKTLQCLQERPAMNISKALWAFSSKLYFMEFPLVPVSKDKAGFFVKDAFKSLRDREFSTTDLIIGVNKDEGSFWLIYYLTQHFAIYLDENNRAIMQGKDPYINKNDYVSSVAQALNRENIVVQQAAAFSYDRTACNQTPISISKDYVDAMNQMVGDYQFSCDSLWMGDTLARMGAKIFVYYWVHESSSNPFPKWLGVIHGSEIEYVFGQPMISTNNHTFGRFEGNEKTLARDMVDFWTNFAKEGTPTIGNRIGSQWPRYTVTERKYYVLKTGKKEVRTALKARECELWNVVRDTHYIAYIAKAASRTSFATQWQSLSIAALVTLTGYRLINRHTD